MYCYHCGKKFDERALEKKQSSYVIKDENGELQEIDSDAQVQYVCPRCGHTFADKRTAVSLLKVLQPWTWF